MLSGFKNFIARGNVVDLAVGVVMGAAFSSVVNGLVESFINPLIAVMVGEPNFDNIAFTFNGTLFPIGQFITATVKFFLIAIAIYLFVVTPMNKLTEALKSEDENKKVEPPENIALLREIRDQLKTLNNRPPSQRNL